MKGTGRELSDIPMEMKRPDRGVIQRTQRGSYPVTQHVVLQDNDGRKRTERDDKLESFVGDTSRVLDRR